MINVGNDGALEISRRSVSRVARGFDGGNVVLVNGAPDSPLLSLKDIFPTYIDDLSASECT